MPQLPDPAGETSDDFEVLPANWEAVQVFIRCGTQWNVAPMGGLVGLNYQGVDYVMRRCRVENMDDVFSRVQVMESAYLAASNQGNRSG